MSSPTRQAESRPDACAFAARVAEVRVETADARSFVLEFPDEGREFGYRAGQFVTVVASIDGREHRRCYSMSSSPSLDDRPRITVKRVADGVVSTWLNDHVGVGYFLEIESPAGAFVLREGTGDIVAFAGGSGITPVFSIVRTALATTARRVRLFYANRDRDSIIFAADLAELAARYPGRLTVEHHLDAEAGPPTATRIAELLGGDAEYFLCGPAPFMDLVQTSLTNAGVARDRLRVERFTVEDAGVVVTSAEPVTLHIRCGKRTATGEHRDGKTLLQAARAFGLRPPSSCETGSCGSCLARITEGRAVMRHNDALSDEEVEDGYVLTCQAVPTGPLVRVDYE